MFWDLFWTPSFDEGLGAEVGFLSIPEVGWKTVSRIEQSPLWAGILAEVDVFLSHRDAVLSRGFVTLLGVFCGMWGTGFSAQRATCLGEFSSIQR